METIVRNSVEAMVLCHTLLEEINKNEKLNLSHSNWDEALRRMYNRSRRSLKVQDDSLPLQIQQRFSSYS